MGSLADYGEKRALDYLFGSNSPATWYFGFSTTAINDDGTGITEPSGNNYARAVVTNNSSNFPAATGSGAGGSLKVNGGPINFNSPSASWGTPGYWFASDAASGGNIVAHGEVSTPVELVAGCYPTIAVGDMNITLD